MHRAAVVVAAVATCTMALAGRVDAQQTPTLVDAPPPASPAATADAEADFQVLDRGPIHEAFAEPVVDPGAIGDLSDRLVPQEPPAPVNELPPEEKPEGGNVQWIPGYWMWSLEEEDFVWVSGVWRNAPPGRRWVPGHWSEADGGFLWTPGFWSDAEAEEVMYLPTPPDTLEQGPSSPAPGEEYFWIPGCWVYQQNDYAWRPGYWYQGQPNWVWVP
ncbi:MAG: YXWGXW repeat-containing protein, partial [Planctomycetales bacterium]|nr:YXWGXW repeat-containing protein [Planctomycetales bacterium]